jgi:hypothetical protein
MITQFIKHLSPMMRAKWIFITGSKSGSPVFGCSIMIVGESCPISGANNTKASTAGAVGLKL